MTDPTFVQGTSLGWLANQVGPFITAYLGRSSVGSETAVEASLAAAIAAAGPIEPMAEARAALLRFAADHGPTDETEATAFVVSGGTQVAFDFVDPIRHDLYRIGRYPSLGPILEQQQLVASHVVVTVERGQYGVTAFGSRAVPDATGRSLGVTPSTDNLIEELRFALPRMIALAGSGGELEPLDEQLRSAFPALRIVHYPTTDLDRDLPELADQVVRDASTVAAEDIAHELSAFRAAAAEGLTVEGPAVIEAIDAGRVTAVLVHDDTEDERAQGTDRLVDIVVAKALATDVRVTMIPDVDDSRGPASGIGGILGGSPIATAETVEPVLVAEAEPPRTGPAIEPQPIAG